MSLLFELSVPLIMLAVGLAAAVSGRDIFASLTHGAMKGLKTLSDIFPALIVLFPAVAMLRASGALDAVSELLSPLCSVLGIPPETLPLALIRPVSGSAATAVAADIIRSCGADSLAGRTAAVMLGSSETTFYVLAVYFSAAKIKADRRVVLAALTADLAVFLSSAWFCGLFWE